MIFLKDTKIYARVWKVEKFEKYLELKISTSEKNRDGQAVYSDWYPRVIGHAFNAIKDSVKEGDTLIITQGKFSNEKYVNKEGNERRAFRFLILDAEIKDAVSDSADTTQSAKETGGDDCPW